MLKILKKSLKFQTKSLNQKSKTKDPKIRKSSDLHSKKIHKIPTTSKNFEISKEIFQRFKSLPLFSMLLAPRMNLSQRLSKQNKIQKSQKSIKKNRVKRQNPRIKSKNQ